MTEIEILYKQYSDNPIKWMQENNCATTKQVTEKLMQLSVEVASRNGNQMNQLFIDLKDWQFKTFPAATANSKLCHLLEEVKEVKEAIATNDKDKRLEFADCFLLLFGAAASDGMSYEDILNAISEKLTICRGREWGEPDANGVYKHIKK